MTYDEIIKSICSRANDPEKDRLEERAKDHFIDAVYGIIDSGAYELEDIPGYYEVEQTLEFTADEYDLTTLTVYKVLEIFTDPTKTLDTSSDTVRVALKTINDISKMANNEEMRPSAEDMFVYRIGNTLYRQKSSPTNITSYESGGGKYYMTYIQNIDDSDWNDSTHLTNYFSTKLIRKAIGIAGVNLLKEDSL